MKALKLLSFVMLVAFCASLSAQLGTENIITAGMYVHPARAIKFIEKSAMIHGKWGQPSLAWVAEDIPKSGDKRKIVYHIFDVQESLSNLKRLKVGNQTVDWSLNVVPGDETIFSMCINTAKYLPGLDPEKFGPVHHGKASVQGNQTCFNDIMTFQYNTDTNTVIYNGKTLKVKDDNDNPIVGNLRKLYNELQKSK